MYCITFLGLILANIIIAMAHAALKKVAPAPGMVKNISMLRNLLTSVLGIWWLIGYFVTCEETYGPTIKFG